MGQHGKDKGCRYSGHKAASQEEDSGGDAHHPPSHWHNQRESTCGCVQSTKWHRVLSGPRTGSIIVRHLLCYILDRLDPSLINVCYGLANWPEERIVTTHRKWLPPLDTSRKAHIIPAVRTSKHHSSHHLDLVNFVKTKAALWKDRTQLSESWKACASELDYVVSRLAFDCWLNGALPKFQTPMLAWRLCLKEAIKMK